MTSASRMLIVNADDFGLSTGINRGILRAHEKGIVTSTSVMVRWPAAAEAAVVAKTHPKLGLGLHVDLGEWFYKDDAWQALYHVLPCEEIEQPVTVRAEIMRQLSRFREIVGANPTHLDSHQHVHRSEPARSILASLAAELNIPLRHFDPRIRYCGDFYGQYGKGESHPAGITVSSLLEIFASLPAGITELCCHPGEVDDYVSQYRTERSIEVESLCDERVRHMITTSRIELTSFREVP